MHACTGAPSQQSQAAAGKTTLHAKAQRQLPSKTAADRVTKRLVHSAKSSIRQGVSVPPAAAAAASPPASTAAASALKHASASGKLGCPKCRHAVYGCKKCRAAFVRSTGLPIPVDRSLHADAFHALQHQSASNHSMPMSSQSVAVQKLPSSANTVRFSTHGKAGQSTGPVTSTKGNGKAVVEVASEGHMGVADRQRHPVKGQRASADREAPSSDRQGSAKRARSEPPVQQPARKKQKAASTSAVPAAVDMSARVSGRVVPGTRRPQSAASPAVSKAHADSAPPAAAAERSSRLSQTPKALAAGRQALPSKASTAAKGSASKLSTAGKAADVLGGKPSSSAKAATQAAGPSSSSARPSLSAAKQPRKAVRLSVPAASARPAAKLRVAALPKQAAPVSKQAHKAIAVLSKTQTRGPSPSFKRAATSGHASTLLKQAAVTAPAMSKAKTVAPPKAMPAAKIRQTPSSAAAAAAGSIVLQGLDSSLGCSKCRFVPSGCKRCRAKQAGRLSLGINT